MPALRWLASMLRTTSPVKAEIGGNSRIISDAANWPPMGNRSLSGYQPKRLWINDGAGHFTDVAQIVGASDTYDGRSVALVDLWNRGALDVVVANQKGPLLIYKNTVSSKSGSEKLLTAAINDKQGDLW